MDGSPQIENWIAMQVRNVWPAAVPERHETPDGGLEFTIRSGSSEWRLRVDPTANRSFAEQELVHFLDREHWLHRLQAERRLCVQWSGHRPSLVRPPDDLM